VFIVVVEETGDKLFTGVNDSDDKLSPMLLLLAIFIAAVVYTGDYALSQTFIDSMTPLNNLSPVTTTPVLINRR
jgi:hypothetical protein